MVAKVTDKQRRNRFIYFFPFQLAALHLKRNHFLMLFWVILIGFTTQTFANKFGIPYLFLAPEYQGVVGFWSYIILGFSLGGFIMAFNIYSYILHARRFPFLGTLARPFFKYCINNFIIPLCFIIVYIYCSSRFLYTTELKSPREIFLLMLAFLSGNALFVALAVIYFFPTNKNIFKITGNTEEQLEALINKRKSGLHQKHSWYFNRGRLNKWHVETYLQHPFKVNLARDSQHYDKETLRKVFFQNHVNASLFELLIIIAFFIVGAFQFNNFFVIPAAASACLVFTATLMIISITMSWLKGWTLTVLIVAILIFDYASGRWDILNMANHAYGLDYEVPPVPYNNVVIDSLNSNLMKVSADMSYHKSTLNKWLDQQRKLKGDPSLKPKMIIINTSGGGLRSSLWTVRTLQYCDSVFQGQVFQNARLISGSSGGIIGATYYRELYLQRDNLKPPVGSSIYRENISKDILNRVLFTFATNDVFIRFRNKERGGHSYVLDRAMTFENQLNQNTDFVLDKKVSDYTDAVSRAEIPMVVFAPSIVNDGRRLLISSQPISYLVYDFPDQREALNLTNENIEFNDMFSNHDARELLLSSALRMNSTFPYILPYASLPTEPKISVMDAGLRDNFGMKITVQYLTVFKDWIEKNTSGVIILQIRDTEKMSEPVTEEITVLDRITNPIGSFYGNYFNDQDYNMDQLLKLASDAFAVPIEQVPFEIRNNPGEHIALSWHLTELEKLRVNRSIDTPWNQQSIKRLKALLNEEK